MSNKMMRMYKFISISLITTFSILSLNNHWLQAKSKENPVIYVFKRPPFSHAGTISADGTYYSFTNANPSQCDLKIKEGCFIKMRYKAKVIAPGIIKLGESYGCSSAVIEKAIIPKNSLLSEHKYESGYGQCTKVGWVPKENYSYYVRVIEMARNQYSSGNIKGAFNYMEDAIFLRPNSAAAYFERGKLRDLENDPIGAIADYAKVIDIDPSFAKTYKLRGLARKELGYQKGACEDWDKAAELGNTSASELLKKHCK